MLVTPVLLLDVSTSPVLMGPDHIYCTFIVTIQVVFYGVNCLEIERKGGPIFKSGKGDVVLYVGTTNTLSPVLSSRHT